MLPAKQKATARKSTMPLPFKTKSNKIQSTLTSKARPQPKQYSPQPNISFWKQTNNSFTEGINPGTNTFKILAALNSLREEIDRIKSLVHELNIILTNQTDTNWLKPDNPLNPVKTLSYYDGFNEGWEQHKQLCSLNIPVD